jgi:O-antigen/teichoic acid export membrane protein
MNLRSSISLSFLLQVLTIIVGFITSIIITRLLGAEGRGEYILVTTSALLLVQALSFGIETTISYFAASKKVALKKLISTVLVIFLLILVLAGMTVWIFSLFPSLHMVPADETFYYLLLFILTGLYIANTFFSSLFNGLKEFRMVLYLTFSIQVMTFLAALVFLVVAQRSASARNFLMVIVLINVLVMIAYLIAYKQRIHIAPSTDLISYMDLRYFLGYSGISFICSLLQFLNYKMDFWIINYFYGNASLGVYSLSATLAQLVWILPQSIALILFPMSSYMQKEELLDVTNKLCRVSVFIVLVLLPFACICALFIPEIFGKDFTGSVRLFYFFLIGTLPYILIKIIASVFAGTGKVIYNFYASFFGFLVALVFYFLLIPAWGLTGGALASSASYMLTAFIGIWFYRYRYGVPLKEILWIRSSDLTRLFSLIRPGRK